MDTITTAAPNNALRERMLQDMTMRGCGEHTQKDYIRHVRSFAAFLGRPPDTATIEDLQRFQIDQHERGVGPATIKGAVSALRFQFGITLKRPEMALGLAVVRCTPKLREVLSFEEAGARGFLHWRLSYARGGKLASSLPISNRSSRPRPGHSQPPN